MLSFVQSTFLIIGCVCASLALLLILRWKWDPARRRDHNDLIGWQVAVLGTLYAVIVGFMLYAVWNDYQIATANTQEEAAALVNVYHFAGGLPPESRATIHKLARDYADAMVNKEWPAMNEGGLSPEGFAVMQQLWSASMQVSAQTPQQQTALNLLLSEMNTMNEYRRLRHLESQTKLPGILWTILVIGGIVTVTSACLFGTDNFKLHALQVLFLATLVSLALAAIADIDQPFRGGVHIQPAAFETARGIMDQLMATPK